MAKVQVIGGSIQDMSDVRTVAQIKTRLSLPNYDAKVNGETPDSDNEEVGEFDFVTLAPKVKGA